MHNILLRARAVVTADSPRNSLACPCGTGHVTDDLNRTMSLPAAEDDRGCHHSVLEPLEEGLVLKMRIVHIKHFIRKAGHLHGHELQSPFFKS